MGDVGFNIGLVFIHHVPILILLLLTQISLNFELLLKSLRKSALAILVDLTRDNEISGATNLIASEFSKVCRCLVAWEAVEYVKYSLASLLIALN